MLKNLVCALGLISVSVGIQAADVTGNNIALKNYRQIFASFHRMTGINVRDPEILTLRQNVLSRLPVNGEISEVSSTSVGAFMEVAGGFCKRFIDIDATRPVAQRRAHAKVMFNAGPKSLTAEVQAHTLREYTQIFWQRDPSAEEEEAMRRLFAATTNGAPGTSDETKKVLQVVCSALAGSIESFIY